MNLRREERLPARIPTLVNYIGEDGEIEVQRANTVDVSDAGGCLEGLRFTPAVGSVLGVQTGPTRARFRVVWTGNAGSARYGQVGIQRLGAANEAPQILYIDDDVAGADVRATKLTALGYQLVRANNAAEAFNVLQVSTFALIIAAYPLRDIDTTELLVAIRRSGAKSKIILLSSYSRIPEDLVELVDAPALKPDPLRVFVGLIERVLEDKKNVKFPMRNYRRYGVRVPVTIEVLRTGQKVVYYGTSMDLSERGIAAEVKAALIPGEMTRVYFSLPNSASEIQAHALVRHRTDETSVYGFEFVSISSQSVQTIKTLCAVLPSTGAAKAAHR